MRLLQREHLAEEWAKKKQSRTPRKVIRRNGQGLILTFTFFEGMVAQQSSGDTIRRIIPFTFQYE